VWIISYPPELRGKIEKKSSIIKNGLPLGLTGYFPGEKERMKQALPLDAKKRKG